MTSEHVVGGFESVKVPYGYSVQFHDERILELFPYSADLVSSIYHLFAALKQYFEGQKFKD
jgi:hypothetical protein